MGWWRVRRTRGRCRVSLGEDPPWTWYEGWGELRPYRGPGTEVSGEGEERVGKEVDDCPRYVSKCIPQETSELEGVFTE